MRLPDKFVYDLTTILKPLFWAIALVAFATMTILSTPNFFVNESDPGFFTL